MNCQRARESFPELLDSRTAATAQLEARTHLAACPDCQREFSALSQTLSALDAMPAPQPTPRLRQNFYAMLEEEKHSAESTRVAIERRQRARRTWWLWRWVLPPLGACALLLLGFMLGLRERSASSPGSPDDGSTKSEIAALREQLARQNAQLEKMTTLVGYSILQQQQNPANERLQEVLAAAQAESPSPTVIDDLIRKLTLDPSANVRLRALEVLYRHAERETVRAGVLAALPREQNPLVQIELIDFVTSTQDRNAAPLLEKMAANESAERSVRDAAKLALAQL